jgi:hypothetical protein
MNLRTLLLFSALAAVPSFGHAGTVGYFVLDTTHSGGNDFINTSNQHSWDFTGANFDLAGGHFVLNVGNSNNTYDIVLNLIDLTANPLADLSNGVNLPPSGIYQAGFAPADMYFTDGNGTDGAWTLDPTHHYRLYLSSTSPTGGSNQWVIKGANNSFSFVDGNNDPIGPSGPAQAPEPGTWMMLAGGMSLVGMSRLRRKAQS